MYLVVRMLKKENNKVEYELKKRDIIKVGRVKFKVKEIKLNQARRDSPRSRSRSMRRRNESNSLLRNNENNPDERSPQIVNIDDSSDSESEHYIDEGEEETKKIDTII